MSLTFCASSERILSRESPAHAVIRERPSPPNREETPLSCARLIPGSEAYDSAVSSSLTVRPARVEDVAQMARVNVRCWQETYRGLMSDAVLDDPGFLAARERFWGSSQSSVVTAPRRSGLPGS